MSLNKWKQKKMQERADAFAEESARIVRAVLLDSKYDGKVMAPEQVAALVPLFVEQMRICIGCGGESVIPSLFIPYKPWEFGVPEYVPGKTRMLFYGLCNSCFSLPEQERTILVENKLRVAERDLTGAEAVLS